MQTDYYNDLQSYFTDMEHLRDLFKNFVSAEKLPKRLIVFHGVGGVGKSSLLRMFRLHCKGEKIPVALASGDEAKSTLDVITRWMEDLKADGVKFSSLHKTLESYRAVQAKVEDQARKSQNKVADLAGKAASKTAEAAGGALLGAAIGSIVPGVGTAIGGMLGSAVGGMGAEALTDWLRGFLDKSAIDLLLDPAKKLTSDFVEDLAKAAEKKRIVLLLDTYEQMSALEDWVGEVAQKIHPNVLVVIAGRKLPDWQRVWSGWMMNAQVEELKPMTEDIMRQLIHRYYATMRGGEPDPAQVDAIVKFARGLPMVVTSAVQLWVKYGVEDFQSVKAEIVANLVDRLMEGVPSALIPALEAAAVVRWFDQPILRAVLNKEDVRDVYNELRRFPFVRTRVEGLALHDSVREMMDENLRMQDSERHCELHERAAIYFEKRLEKATGEDAEHLELERLYHRVCANEEDGIKLFQDMAEELHRYRFVNRLRSLLSDVNVYPLIRENSNLWREYYKAKLEGLGFSWWRSNSVEAVYETLANNLHADPKLRAFAMCDLSTHLTRSSLLKELEGVNKALEVIAICQGLISHLTDGRRDIVFKNLSNVYVFRGEREKALEIIEQQLDYSSKQNDTYGVINNLQRMKYSYAENGNWQKALTIRQRLNDTLQQIQIPSKLIDQIIIRESRIEVIYTGRYFDAEQAFRQALKLCEDKDVLWNSTDPMRGLAYALGLQTKYDEAGLLFAKIIEDALKENNKWVGEITYLRLGEILTHQGDLSRAQEFLLKSLLEIERIGSNDVAAHSNRLGKLHEIKSQVLNSTSDLIISESYYRKAINYQWSGRLYHHCTALTGLLRVKYMQGDYAAIPPLLAEAEQLVQKYEYNDCLVSLRLTQGHLAWENNNKTDILSFYQQAMIYALRFNRFLLDELLGGRPQGTPLRSIIPYCLERGEEGRKILLALRDWWKKGANDIGTPRPDTISPIPEGILLVEAEKIAREREPGDGSMHKSVLEQIEAAL